jgi:MoxR-like ATPase
LPEAELDRFLFKVLIRYPSAEDELKVLQAHHLCDPEPTSLPVVLQVEDLIRARQICRDLVIQPEVMQYAIDLIRATRDDPNIAVGGSPRAGLWLVRAAKAIASLAGRDYVIPEDIQQVWTPVLRHRIMLEPSAEVENLDADDALAGVLRAVPAPH